MNAAFLRKLSITYILLPNLLFAYGWFRQPYSSLLICGYLFLLLREFFKSGESEDLRIKEIVFLTAFALIWTFFMGAGGFSQQKSDFFAHNGKFYDLYKNPWPTYFPEIDRYACYYFGYYLVPSFLAKIIGQLSPILIYGWTALGCFLGLCWVYLLIERWKTGIFLFFWLRGIGYVLYLVSQKFHLADIPIYRPVINGLVQHSSYVPNQFIGTLIVTCLLIHDVFIRKQIREAALPVTLVFIWGIFPSITLTLMYAILWAGHWYERGNLKELFKCSSIPAILLPAVLLLPTIGYFLSANSSTIHGFLWQFDRPLNTVLYYVIGVGFDIVLYYYLTWRLKDRNILIPFWLINSLFATLFIFSLYRVGFNNDWFYRTQIPIFIIVVIVVLRGFHFFICERLLPKPWTDRLLAGVMIAMMVLQLSAYVHLLRDNILIKKLFPTLTSFKPLPYDRFPNTYQLMKTVYGNRGDAEQYLGQKNSFYERYLAKQIPDEGRR
jgi:hypothetical protein